VTAWESFIEDTIRGCAISAILRANHPSEVQSLFNSVAQRWLDEKPKPAELVDWTGDEWKALLRNKLEKDILRLNTLNSENVRDLSRRYLGEDPTTRWRWEGTTPTRAAGRFDALIRLRGELAHRGREVFQRNAVVQRRQVVEAISLLEHLAECTQRALGTAPFRRRRLNRTVHRLLLRALRGGRPMSPKSVG
jgi:hypothetical protein